MLKWYVNGAHLLHKPQKVDIACSLEHVHANLLKAEKKLEFHGSRVSATMRDTAKWFKLGARTRYSACQSRHKNCQKREIPGTLFFGLKIIVKNLPKRTNLPEVADTGRAVLEVLGVLRAASMVPGLP